MNYRPRGALDQVDAMSLADRLAIFDLVARFDDAVNRRDRVEFRKLWSADAIWEIGQPRPMRTQGADLITETWYAMGGHFSWLFRGSFAGVVIVDGDSGTGRWPCVETGSYPRGDTVDPPGYDNRAVYEDEYTRQDGHWLFSRRCYSYLWLSSKKLPGNDVARDQGAPA